MNPAEFYSAKREDLYFPCKNAAFFPLGRPATDAALCAELSRIAYCQNENNFAFDQERIKQTLASVGLTVRAFVESSKCELNHGFHCFLAVRESGNAEERLAVIAFRGTNKDDPTNLFADGDALFESWEKGGEVHRGFKHALGELRGRLDALRPGIDCRILFTGHSLGAALATLLAGAWKRPTDRRDALFTFGSPRVGNPQFVATLAGLAGERYVDCCDGVTLVPPEMLGYRHFGHAHYIARNRRVIVAPGTATLLADKFAAVVQYALMYGWRPGNVTVRDLADHAPINYVMAVGSNLP